MIDQVLQKLIEFLENASPAVWEALIKQVHANAIGYFVWGGLLVVLCIILILVTNWIRKESIKDNDEDGTWYGVMFFVVLFSMGSVLVMVYNFMAGWKMLYNPNYYAIMDIIKSIQGIK